MRSIIKIICLSSIAVALLIPYYPEKAQAIAVRPVSPSGRQVTGDQWLFVIGIDTYIEWPRLNTAVNDARSVKDVLLSLYHFNKDHLIELYDEQATRRNILGKLVYLAKNVRDDDSLVIYYAGHGNLDPITKSGSWIPVESSTNNVSAWISNHDIKNYLRVDAIKAKHILLISDSCFSGDFFRGHRGKLPEVTDKVIKKAYELTSRQAISSGGLEPVSDEGFGNNSVFSHFLVKALKKNQKPFLIPSDLFPGIKAGVAENAEQFPRFGSLKDTGGQQGGELVLFLKQDARLQTLSAQALSKQAEFERLKQMEAAAAEAKQKEAAEIARREKELAALDSKIEGMRKRLGTASIQADDGLDAMLAMVKEKEKQQKRIEELKKQRIAEEEKRRAEIDRLKTEKRNKILAQLEKDIHKYHEIVSSPFGKGMKATAWQSLISKYPYARATDLKIGDIKGLRFKVGYGGIVNSIGMKFVKVPPGTFMMGSPSNEPGRGNDEKRHRVTLTKGFYMQTTEVTQGQWKAVMGSNPSKFKNCGDDCPVEKVSWNDVRKFIRKLNQREGGNKYRLPTEAEWEYAARAGSTGKFCFSGDNGNLRKYAWYDRNSGGKTHPVAQKQPNAWGLYDMHGNVYEWCQDWYGDYPSASVTNPTGPSGGSYRVVRGGSWDFYARLCRSAYRYSFTPGGRFSNLGFRLLRNP